MRKSLAFLLARLKADPFTAAVIAGMSVSCAIVFAVVVVLVSERFGVGQLVAVILATVGFALWAAVFATRPN